LHDSKDVDLQNQFEVSEKLQLALEMAESIAELHGFKDGVIVHDDVQLCQWLRNDQGKLKLGDFNRARVLQWNDEKQEYCKYNNGKSYGNVRMRFVCLFVHSSTTALAPFSNTLLLSNATVSVP
jgi:hypothetical protein